MITGAEPTFEEVSANRVRHIGLPRHQQKRAAPGAGAIDRRQATSEQLAIGGADTLLDVLQGWLFPGTLLSVMFRRLGRQPPHHQLLISVCRRW
jgi:hypothetical protein